MLNMSTGLYVEAYVKEVFADLFPAAYREATEEEDRHQGTDFFIGDVPVDVTLDENKNFSKFIKKYMLDGITVNVMIRYRNAVSVFERPVLVFQFETYDLRDRFLICELIEENLTRDIVAQILGFYN